jgi:hypothetical protein
MAGLLRQSGVVVALGSRRQSCLSSDPCLRADLGSWTLVTRFYLLLNDHSLGIGLAARGLAGLANKGGGHRVPLAP